MRGLTRDVTNAMSSRLAAAKVKPKRQDNSPKLTDVGFCSNSRVGRLLSGASKLAATWSVDTRMR